MVATAVAIKETGRSDDRPRERALDRLWRQAHMLSDGLRSEDGRRWRIVYPGRPSGQAGPDFRDSVIETESGELLTGDIELHVDAPSWDSHRHNLDPNYNGVILHVALHTKGVVTSRQRSKIDVPVASLRPLQEFLRNGESASQESHGLSDVLGGEAVGEALDRAGDERFLARSRGNTLELKLSDPEETLYTAILEALGYSANRKPFRELARLVPMATLRHLGQEPAITRLMAVKAMLLNAAGLLSDARVEAEADDLRPLLKRLPKTGVIAPGSWHTFRVRPANHPAMRIIGAAHLADRYLASGLVDGFAREVDPAKPRVLEQRLSARPYVGASRAREVAISAVLPFFHAWAGIRRDGALQAASLEMYRSFPSPGDNEITREMRRLLSSEGETVKVTGARRHQGLVHLYRVKTGRVSRRAK